MASVEEALRTARERLQGRQDTARLDAEVLLAWLLERDRSFLHAHPEHTLDEGLSARYQALVERRAEGEPIAYLTGEREFWSLPLRVSPDVLIPRPETELLVEQALARIPAEAESAVADLGTGSGAIALAIARERPRCRVLATDRSAEALEVARGNAERLGIDNVEFAAGNWAQALGDRQFDLVVSNPPYVVSGDPHLTQGDARHEPRLALQAGPDGLDAIRVIAFQAKRYLLPGGWLLLEHGFDQGSAVRALLQRYGYADVATEADLAGQPRVSRGRAPA